MIIAGLLLLAAGRAEAGACCVATTGTMPTRVSECERWLVGLGVAGEQGLGYWSAAGQAEASSLHEQALVASLGLAVRMHSRIQLGATLPGRLNHKTSGGLEQTGWGAGDLRLATTLTAIEEGTPGGEGLAAPRLDFTLGLRLPTGTSWEQSGSTLLADVTGLPGTGITAGAALERTFHQTPWSVGLEAEVPVGAEGAPPLITASAAVGRYLGTKWSVAASIRYSATVPVAGQDLATRTGAGLRLVRGERMAWRAWLGIDMDLPLDRLGRSNPMMATVGGGVAVVR